LLFGTLIAGIYYVAGLDPITALTASMTGFGTLGILTLQMLAAVAVVVHFRRSRDPRLWKTLVAPSLGALGLALIVLLAILNFTTLAGSDNPIIGALPWLLVVAVLTGLATAQWLKSRRPEIYHELLSDMEHYDIAHRDLADATSTSGPGSRTSEDLDPTHQTH